MRKFIRTLFIAGVVGLFSVAATAQTAPTVTLTATPATGVSPLDVTLTWSSTGATGCTASGAWSGAKATSGTQVIIGVTSNTSYNLLCSTSTGTATLSWVAPTANVDGTALTNLAGFKVYSATTSAGVASATAVVINNPSTLTYAAAGLSSGTWYFGLKAFNAAAIDSDMTGLVSKAIVLASASASASVTVTTKPNPPTLVTVSQTAYDLKNGRLYRVVGEIPLNTPCGAFVVKQWGTKYYELPLDKVTITRTPRSTRVVGRCESGFLAS